MKSQINTNKNVPVLSRLTQKTFITIMAFAFACAVAMMVKYYFDILQMGDLFKHALYTLYPVITVVGPLLTFIVVYLISKEKVTKLWRICKAAIIALMSLIFQTFMTQLTMSSFASPVMNADGQLSQYNYLLEIVPLVLSVAVAVLISRMITKSKAAQTSDVSKFLQKSFLLFVLLFGLGQPVLSLLMYQGARESQPIEIMIYEMLFSLIIPILIMAVIFLMTSRRRTLLERIFITIFYTTMGVFLMIPLASIPFLFTDPQSMSINSWAMMYLPTIIAFALFAGIVIWHKMKKVL